MFVSSLWWIVSIEQLWPSFALSAKWSSEGGGRAVEWWSDRVGGEHKEKQLIQWQNSNGRRAGSVLPDCWMAVEKLQSRETKLQRGDFQIFGKSRSKVKGAQPWGENSELKKKKKRDAEEKFVGVFQRQRLLLEEPLDWIRSDPNYGTLLGFCS